MREVRRIFGIARCNALVPARDRFVELLRDCASQVEAQQPAGAPPGLNAERGYPPEIVDLADELLPRIEAFDIACGVPFYVDRALMLRCQLCGAQEELPSVKSALVKVVKLSE